MILPVFWAFFLNFEHSVSKNNAHQHGGTCITVRSTAEPVHALMALISIEMTLHMTLMSLDRNNAAYNSILGESLLYSYHFSLAGNKLDFKMLIFT
jgi:hypothetical protein